MLVTTGRFGFKTYDVSDPTSPQLLDTFQPAGILGANGYWQDEDMDLDVRRKLIIGSLDPRHDDVDQASCPGIGTLGSKNRNPVCRSGFYVISYADPANLRQIGDFVEVPAGHTSSCIEKCHYIWTGGPARRNDQADLGAFTPGGRGDGRPIWVTDLTDPANPRVLPEPIDLWRNDGATDYSHDVDVDANGIAWTSGRGGLLGYATRGRWRDPRTDTMRVASRGIRSSSPAAASRAATTASPSRRPTSSTTPRGRSTAPSAPPVSPPATSRSMTEEDFTTPVQPGRPHRRRGHHRLARRGTCSELHAGAALPDEGTERVPPDAGRPGHRGAHRRLLGALLRAVGLDARGRLVRPGPPTDRRLQRSQPPAGRLLLRHRDGPPRTRARSPGTPPGAAI